jgi:hypothetical protein
MNERISLFYLNRSLELYLPKQSCVCGYPPVQKLKSCWIFKLLTFWQKRMDYPPWKMSLFVGHGFSRKRDHEPHLKFYMKAVARFIYRMPSRMLVFCGRVTDFRGVTGIYCCFRAWCIAQRSIQTDILPSLVSFDRYTFYLVACVVWRWVVYLGYKNKGTSLQKLTAGKS